MHRRHFAQGLLAGTVILGATGVQAREPAIPLALDVQQSRYIFEGLVEAVSGTEVRFLVVASWKGTPPVRARIRLSGRMHIPAEATGQTYLVFARGESDETLSYARAGATGPVHGALTAQLIAIGLTRRVMP